MNEELWKVIPFESNYEVSTYGRIRNASTQQIKSQRFDRYGYKRVTLYPSAKTYVVHQLVAKVWLGDMSQTLQINHKDFDKTNNYVDNLEWCSIKENCRHREDHLDPRRLDGSKNPVSTYTEEEVLQIRELYSDGKKYRDIARMLGRHSEAIRRIVRRESWTHI